VKKYKMAEKTHCEACNRNFPSGDALAMHNSAKHPITNSKSKKTHTKTIFIVLIISVLLIGGFLFFENKSVTGNSNNNNPGDSGNIQKITLGFKSNYYPNTIKVKQGIPVEITLDSSIRGCYRNFNIPQLGVSKSSSSPTDTIKFTPDQKGTFGFRCGMGMGTGTIIVE
jgi:plastocyanin domain-containing protein